jgi:hypothetical protein
MAKIRRLTPKSLRKMVIEEKRRLARSKRLKEVLETGEEDAEKVAKKAPEVDADEFADSIELDIDFMKALKIEEKKLRRKFRKISEAKRRLRKRIVKKL